MGITGLSERERQLLELLMDDMSLSVSQLSKHFNVSAVTVRSDLGNLEEKGFIIRTHGGAFPTYHPDILRRQKENVDTKKKLAKAAAGFINNGDTVMIEAGTTTALIPRYLMGMNDIHIVTNSTLTLQYGRSNPSLHLTFTGGIFRSITESMVGPSALEDLSRFYVKVAFIGTDGFSIKNGLTTHDIEGAEIVRMMVEKADKVILIADSSKYNQTGFVHVLPLNRVDTLITDSGISAEAEDEFKKAGLDYIKV